jgi:hypothetical protein
MIITCKAVADWMVYLSVWRVTADWVCGTIAEVYISDGVE